MPHSVHPRTLDSLDDKRLIREVTNPRGGSNWCVLTGLGQRVADTLTEESRATAGPRPAVVEGRRDVLRATIRSRAEAPTYAISVEGAAVPKWQTVMQWGHAMASAQKSIRNGAHITPGDGGAFTLTSPNGGRRAHFRPA